MILLILICKNLFATITCILIKIIKRTRFVCSPFATTHYVTAYKTIHIYYLKKSHDSLNRSYDLKYMWMILLGDT